MASFYPHNLLSLILFLLISPLSLAEVSTPWIVEKQLKYPSLVQPVPSIQEFGHHAGYYKLPHSKDARMFYYFFESRNNKSDPVVIWLGGDMGCSGSVGLFYEMGPFQITQNLSLVWNEYGWDQASNLIFIDLPIGTGFSYTTDESDNPHNEEDLSNRLYDFLQEFFKQHLEFVKNDLYITGEYEMGYYIPAVASRINKGNKGKEGIPINLKGMAIGDGFANSTYVYQGYPDYALNMGLLVVGDYDMIVQEDLQRCLKPPPNATEDFCWGVFSSIMIFGKVFNPTDIRKQCQGRMDCLDVSTMETFLNQKPVRDALGVGDMRFAACTDRGMVAARVNLADEIPVLLDEGFSVLLYHGEYDFLYNWLGSYLVANSWKWSGQEKFRAAPTVPFVVDGKNAGKLKTHGPLSLLKVYDAASMVPMDQPKASLQMLKSWMQGKLV